MRKYVPRHSLVWRPGCGLLRIGDVQRVFGVAVLSEAQMQGGGGLRTDQFLDLRTPSKMRAVGAPGADHGIGPGAALGDSSVISWTGRVRLGAHFSGVGGAPGEDVANPERAETERAGATFAPLYGRVVLNFGGGGRVQHDEEGAATVGLPYSGQTIAVAFAW